MTQEKEIEKLIANHIKFRDSFTRIEEFFTVSFIHKNKKYTPLGKDMVIKEHLDKTVNKILDKCHS